jgi:Mrp family chromosome partitioning ATPase
VAVPSFPDGKPNREIRAKIDEAKGKKAPTAGAATATTQKPANKTTEAPKEQTYRIDLPSATVTVNFKKGPVSKSSVKAMLLQALESLG